MNAVHPGTHENTITGVEEEGHIVGVHSGYHEREDGSLGIGLDQPHSLERHIAGGPVELHLQVPFVSGHLREIHLFQVTERSVGSDDAGVVLEPGLKTGRSGQQFV